LAGLHPKQERWKKWIGLYNEKDAVEGDFKDLRDRLRHPLRDMPMPKDGKMYYAFFSSSEWQGEVELRGLGPGKHHVTDYSEGERSRHGECCRRRHGEAGSGDQGPSPA
jgi:hypothetical protein